MVSVAKRGYLSTHLLWSAEHLTAMSKAIEDGPGELPRFDIRHRSYTVGAVLAAVAFLEASINEVFQDAADEHPSYVGELDIETRSALSRFWRESEGKVTLLSKFQYALVLARKDGLDRGTRPLQDANLLVMLRNALVHDIPETVVSGSMQRLEARLRGKFHPNRLLEGTGNPFFPDKCLGAGCGEWSVSTARALADATFERLGIRPNYQRVSWGVGGDPVESPRSDLAP